MMRRKYRMAEVIYPKYEMLRFSITVGPMTGIAYPIGWQDGWAQCAWVRGGWSCPAPADDGDTVQVEQGVLW